MYFGLVGGDYKSVLKFHVRLRISTTGLYAWVGLEGKRYKSFRKWIFCKNWAKMRILGLAQQKSASSQTQ